MKNLNEILEGKRGDTHLEFDDLMKIEDSPNWRERHPLGPMTFCVRCKICGAIIFDDFDTDLLHDRNFWGKNIAPHFEAHV